MMDFLSNSSWWASVVFNILVGIALCVFASRYVRRILDEANENQSRAILGAWEIKALAQQQVSYDKLSDLADKTAQARWCANASDAAKGAQKGINDVHQVLSTLHRQIANNHDVVCAGHDALTELVQELFDQGRKVATWQQAMATTTIVKNANSADAALLEALNDAEIIEKIKTIIAGDRPKPRVKSFAEIMDEPDVHAARKRFMSTHEFYQDPPLVDALPYEKPVEMPAWPFRRSDVEVWLKDVVGIDPDDEDYTIRYPRVGWTTAAVNHWLLHESEFDLKEHDHYTSDQRFNLVKQQRQCDGAWCNQATEDRLLMQYPLDLLFSLSQREQESVADAMVRDAVERSHG